LATTAHAAAPLAVTGGSPVAVGEYLVAIGGCNDCHTEGWNKAPGAIPPAQRLAGVAIGWHGPWGTSYAINLRLLMQRLSVEQWLGYVETMQPKPPMPWFNMRAMSETDLKAMYAYIRSLGPAGVATPADLPPGQKPTTPYIEALPQPPKP
ncbi:MAG TPA: c-type cytochrome, partial [Acetobacteraceae bacterium]|nr:c-type cytochrome [Acetobacteraceae bacterium]